MDGMVDGLEALVPAAGQADMDALRTVDAGELAAYVAHPSHPWWRRRACAAALAGRVPDAHVAELSARVRDTGDTPEVRTALLEVLSERAELLPWLCHEDRLRETGYGMSPAILQARGRLGDLSAARELATLAFAPVRRAAGEAGLDALAARYGDEAIRAELGTERPEDRAAHLRIRHRAGEDVSDGMADPDPGVAFEAQEYLTDPERLRAHLHRAPTTDAKLWAAFALYRLTEDVDEPRAVYESLGRPRVEVPGLDEEIRRAIVHRYAPWHCERSTDPRWRLEALCTAPPPPVDHRAQLHRAVRALTAAGLEPGRPVSADEYHQQGEGTYDLIDCGDDTVLISTLGRFATSGSGGAAAPAARDALMSAGFRWIDTSLAAIPVTGLCVYYFGSRKPLPVDTLLFHWQD
ncbi:hypothetical protein [Streptomyces abyssomicinicus]|uniref:hypothetical protein n=1 Tax=Streptomyces abyssomicinicus TaxID=574929 RepID=UPI001FE61BB8|nr:hypothetical protein [Streptomyces abyssomicinicus]